MVIFCSLYVKQRSNLSAEPLISPQFLLNEDFSLVALSNIETEQLSISLPVLPAN